MTRNTIGLDSQQTLARYGIPHRLKLLNLMLVAFMAGCGGGGDGGDVSANGESDETTPPSETTPADESAAGIWRGSVTSGGNTYQSTGLVSEADDVRLITTGSTQISGTIDVKGKNFTAVLRSYAPPTFYYSITAPIHGTSTGTINQTSALLGNINLLDGTTYNLTFNYDALYERDSSLAAVAGNYSRSDGAGLTVTYSIDGAGVFTGSDTNGCVMNGNVSIINSDFNMYEVKVAVTNCGQVNGNYKGLAALDDVVTLNDTLLFSLESSDQTTLISGAIPRR